jgi:hypothetical protein
MATSSTLVPGRAREIPSGAMHKSPYIQGAGEILPIRLALVSTAKGGGLMSNCFGERVTPREFTKDSIAFRVRF